MTKNTNKQERDTAGNIIYERMLNCRCNLTGGCKDCKPVWTMLDEIPITKEEYNYYESL